MSVIVSAALAATLAGSFQFDRVDLLSEDPGVWLNHELPGTLAYPVKPAVRLLTQVKPVWATPVPNLYVGTSLVSQSVVYEHPLWAPGNLWLTGGLQTRWLMPRGALAGLAWRYGRVRVGLGMSAVSDASWARPSWTHWSFLPTVGIGVGRLHQPPVAGAE
jgi:hypothetical protein